MIFVFFFYMQKTAYEVRISDWSSDVCSSDLLAYQIAPELRAGRLKILLEDYEPAPIPVHLVQLGGRRAPARVRAFVDFAASRLRRTLAEKIGRASSRESAGQYVQISVVAVSSTTNNTNTDIQTQTKEE